MYIPDEKDGKKEEEKLIRIVSSLCIISEEVVKFDGYKEKKKFFLRIFVMISQWIHIKSFFPSRLYFPSDWNYLDVYFFSLLFIFIPFFLHSFISLIKYTHHLNIKRISIMLRGTRVNNKVLIIFA